MYHKNYQFLNGWIYIISANQLQHLSKNPQIYSMSTQQSSQKYSKFGQAFISYGSYHVNLINKIIHIICIPLIAATLFSLLSFIPYSITFESLPLIGSFTFGPAEALGVIGVVYYISLNPIFGVLSGVFMIAVSAVWRSFFKDYSTEELFKAVFIIQVVAWVLQFIGHGVFQKRKPALLDNISQILNAPMFVLIQLCELFGLKTKEIDEWKVQVDKKVVEFRQKSQKTN